MRRSIFGLEAWARCCLCLSMVLKGREGRVGDRFGISKRLPIVDTASINAWLECQGCSEAYCSDDSIHSSLPGIGENVGALGGS